MIAALLLALSAPAWAAYYPPNPPAGAIPGPVSVNGFPNGIPNVFPTVTMTGSVTLMPGPALTASVISVSNVLPTVTVTGTVSAQLLPGPAIAASILSVSNVLPTVTVTGTVKAQLVQGAGISASVNGDVGILLDVNQDGIPEATWGATTTGQGRIAALVIPSSGATLLEAVITVGTSPTALAAISLPSGSHLVLYNNTGSPGRTVFIGGPNVTIGTGLPVTSGSSLDLSPYTGAANQVFGIVGASTGECRILRW